MTYTRGHRMCAHHRGSAVYVFTSISSCLLRPFWQRPKLSKSDSLPRVRSRVETIPAYANERLGHLQGTYCFFIYFLLFFFLLPINVLFTVRRSVEVVFSLSLALFLSPSTCRRTLRRSADYIAAPLSQSERIKFFPSLTRKSPKRF